ncbi:pentapeptide repeat-containing protein [Amycolatopsis sp. NPDC021455]|uniref:pentapeptide repeat-containing protein n=1 Tax=Amycolatopsis sp. NPDC021455 TaxID=3154901 RepID=UPI0033E623DD
MEARLRWLNNKIDIGAGVLVWSVANCALVNEVDPNSASKAAAPTDRLASRSATATVLPWRALALTAVAIFVFTGIVIVTLWWVGSRGLSGSDLVAARFDAVKIGLSVGVGGGGVVALYLNWRRQRSSEADLDNRERTLVHQQQVAAENRDHQAQVAADARIDAAARRITELFTKAAEHLGSDSLPVRLAAFYALERLGQENESQRASVRKLFCAYLRMPFDSDILDSGEGECGHSKSDYRRVMQEREVRLSVQQILLDHFNPDVLEKFWPGQELDLARATLIDFDLTDLNVNSISFKDAIFVGDAKFVRTLFADSSTFANARFSGRAKLSGSNVRRRRHLCGREIL